MEINKKGAIGVISIGYQLEYGADFLRPFQNLEGFLVNFVYGVTPELAHTWETFDHVSNVQPIIKSQFNSNNIIFDYFIDVPTPEYELRNLALRPLIEEFDYIMILDSDEFYTVEQLQKISDFVRKDNFIHSYSIPFKNMINFEGREGYLLGFNPPRIWNNRLSGGIDKFYWDNDIQYKDGRNQSNISTKLIPIDSVSHFSWVGSPARIKNKIDYQFKHFAHGAGCSYFLSEKGGVTFNNDYFSKTGQPKPTIIFEE